MMADAASIGVSSKNSASSLLSTVAVAAGLKKVGREREALLTREAELADTRRRPPTGRFSQHAQPSSRQSSSMSNTSNASSGSGNTNGGRGTPTTDSSSGDVTVRTTSTVRVSAYNAGSMTRLQKRQLYEAKLPNMRTLCVLSRPATWDPSDHEATTAEPEGLAALFPPLPRPPQWSVIPIAIGAAACVVMLWSASIASSAVTALQAKLQDPLVFYKAYLTDKSVSPLQQCYDAATPCYCSWGNDGAQCPLSQDCALNSVRSAALRVFPPHVTCCFTNGCEVFVFCDCAVFW